MQHASAEDLEANIRGCDTEPEALRSIVGTDDIVTEVRCLAEDAARMLAKAGDPA